MLEPVDCGGLTQPANGQVTLNGTVYDSRATYTCDDGFSLVGSASRVCQADGSWSPNPPSCLSETSACSL